jgi:peroxiredoxin
MPKQAFSFFVLFVFSNALYGQKAIISGNIKNLTTNSIKCSFIPNTVLEKPVAITIPVTEGKFIHTLTITETTFLSFEEGNNYYGGFIQPGDSIVITYDAAKLKNTLSFSGKGKEGFILIDPILQLRSVFNDESEKIKNHPFPVDYLFNKIDSLKNKLVQRLHAYKPLMSTESFNLLYAFVEANVLRSKYNGVLNIFGDAYDDVPKKHPSRLTTISKRAIQDLLKFDGNLSYSYFYTSNVSNILSVYYDDNIRPRTRDDLQSKYNYLNNHLPLKLKSPVLYLSIAKDIQQNKGAAIDSIIEQSFPFSKDSTYKKFITQQLVDARALKVGIPAPDFSLENTNGEKVSLSSFKGKVIYIDFWFAACVPCHKLFKDIRSVKEYFKSNSNVIFLTVSVDNNEVWKNALTKFNIEGYHAFTENKFRDHPVIRTYNVKGYPTTYLIDRNGKLFNLQPSHNPDELRKEIEAALMIAGN